MQNQELKRNNSDMARKSIASRWFMNSFGVVAILLVIIDVIVFFSVKNYYYNTVKQYLQTEANILSGVLIRFYNGTPSNYVAEIRNAVEQFDKKDQMELMAIINGRVGLTSSGFSPKESYDMPDYIEALNSPDGMGYYVGVFPNNEKYMAVTTIIQDNSSIYNAIRVVVSLDKVDSQIYSVGIFLGVVSIFVLLLLLMLGAYFIKSIVSPLRHISVTARRLAVGDFSVRVEADREDEIGELCRVFNYMADALENSETIKNDFISSVSHELRTPLTAIKGWSETILELRDEDALEKGMRVILTETERLNSMVEELLDFSRIQSGKFTLQRTNIDVLAELTDALLVYEERAKREGISIIYNEPAEIAIIYGDKNRIRQVFINIIDNAIKYSNKGGTVTIEALVNENSVDINIQDSGCGISAADLPKIKNRFYKANNTVRGSGIGLAVADEIISLHGGTLDIMSELGVGTTVMISLPILQKKAEEKTEE